MLGQALAILRFSCADTPRTLKACSIAAVLLAAVATADEGHDHAGGDPELVGSVSFPVSCSAPARAQFEHAVALLHSFWYEQAEKAFARVVATDPHCTMGYWGEAMSNWHPLWEPPTPAELGRGRSAAEKAKAMTAVTERERGYVAAVVAFYAGGRPPRERAAAYTREMEQLHRHHPEDLEATIFYALGLDALQRPEDKTRAEALRAGRLLEEVLPKLRGHPGVAHYIIHSYDYPELAARALPAARQYAKIAPGVPHALHMPSHIFTRLGLWQESIQSNLAAVAAGQAFSKKNFPGAAWSEQLHALDYLEYAYLQLAEDNDAHQVVQEAAAILKTVPEDMKAAYALAAIPARNAVERQHWAEAKDVPLHPAVAWERYPWTEAIVWFARGLGAARMGDATSARAAVDRLTTLKKSLDTKEPYWSTQVEVQRLAVAAWLAHAERDDALAESLMRAAANLEDSTEKHAVTPGPLVPARELLGELLLELRRPREAERELEASLARAPNRFAGVAAAARAAHLAGDEGVARTRWAELVALGVHADGNRPELLEARTALGTAP